ncbi:protein of unknown function [Burkholderia multivorans]
MLTSVMTDELASGNRSDRARLPGRATVAFASRSRVVRRLPSLR